MIMIGDMFNNGLKYRVDSLCNDLTMAMQNNWPFAPVPMPPAAPCKVRANRAGGQFFHHERFPGRLWAPLAGGVGPAILHRIAE
jgi:hypothetical protein